MLLCLTWTPSNNEGSEERHSHTLIQYLFWYQPTSLDQISEKKTKWSYLVFEWHHIKIDAVLNNAFSKIVSKAF